LKKTVLNLYAKEKLINIHKEIHKKGFVLVFQFVSYRNCLKVTNHASNVISQNWDYKLRMVASRLTCTVMDENDRNQSREWVTKIGWVMVH